MFQATPAPSPLLGTTRHFLVRLVAATVLINLVVGGLAAFYLYRSRQQYESRIASQTFNLSQSLSQTLAGILDKSNVALFSIKREAERQIASGGIDSRTFNDYILEHQGRIPELDALRVTDARGDILYGNGALVKNPINVADRDVFFRSRDDSNAGLVIGPPLFGRTSKKWVFQMGYRINNPDGSFAGVVFCAISLDYLYKMFSSFDLGAYGVVTLRDDDLAVVVRYPEPRSIGSRTVSREMRALRRAGHRSGTYKTGGSIDSTERTFSYHKIASYPLYVNVGRATSDYLLSWRNDAKVSLGLVTLFSSGSLLSALLIYRNRRQQEAAGAELIRHREELERTVRSRTAELEERNCQLAEEIITRKQIESDLEKAATIMEKMADTVHWISSEGKHLYGNEAACTRYGYSREEMRSLSLWDIAPGFPPEAWPDHWERLKREKCLHLETTNITRDGKVFPVEVTANYLNIDGKEYDCAIVRDISERKEAEEEKQNLMVQLAQSQKMESIGRLAGGIAHDFNNLLTPILGYTELLKLSFPPGSREYERIGTIYNAADKAKTLTQQLLSFSRKQILEMKVIDLNEVVSSFYEILRRTVRENISIKLHLTGKTFGIRADQNQVEQIIMNLAINAQDAIDGRGVITIETAPIRLDEEYARQHAGVEVGEYLMLAVTDSGSGMDRETLAHMFEPFFTTKADGKGTGLGLATVYGLVKQHEGHVWVYSEKGKGTAFKIYFPLVKEKPEAAAAEAQKPSGFKAEGRTILLVEDNQMVRELTHDVLESFGSEIVVAEGPKQAIRMTEGKPLDLMVTDVVMPEMNGPELYQKLLKEHPGLKVIYMSGYTNNAIVHHGVLDKDINFIQKPFALDDLARMVEGVFKG